MKRFCIMCLFTLAFVCRAFASYPYEFEPTEGIGCLSDSYSDDELHCIYYNRPTFSIIATGGYIDNERELLNFLDTEHFNHLQVEATSIVSFQDFVSLFLERPSYYNDIMIITGHGGDDGSMTAGEDFKLGSGECKKRLDDIESGIIYSEKEQKYAKYLSCSLTEVNNGFGAYHESLFIDYKAFFDEEMTEAYNFGWDDYGGINTVILPFCYSKLFADQIVLPRIGIYGKIIYAPDLVHFLLNPMYDMGSNWGKFFEKIDGSYVEGFGDNRDFIPMLNNSSIGYTGELLEYVNLFDRACKVNYYFGPDTQLDYAEFENDETGEMCYWDYNTSREHYKSTEFCYFPYESSSFNAYFEFTDMVESDWRFYLDGLESYKVEKTIIDDSLSLKFTNVIYEEPLSHFSVFISGLYLGPALKTKFLDSDGDKVSDGGPKYVFNVHIDFPQNNPEEIVDRLNDLPLTESVFFENPVDEANNLKAVEVGQHHNPIHSIQAQTEDEYRCVEGYCTIDSRCIRDGDEQPNNPCLVCDITQSTTDWTRRPYGTACEDDRWCTVGNTCIEGVCGVRRECDDGIWCNGDEVCAESIDSCYSIPRCPNDPFFCNGVESCDEEGHKCLQTGNPCSEELECDEEKDICVEPHPDDDTGDDDTGDDDVVGPDSPVLTNVRMEPDHVVLRYHVPYGLTYETDLKWQVCDPNNDLLGGQVYLYYVDYDGRKDRIPMDGMTWNDLHNPPTVDLSNAGDCVNPVSVQYNIIFCLQRDIRKYIQGHP